MQIQTWGLLVAGGLFVGVSAPAYAQSEAALKDYFEGKNVVVKVDMPATQEGVDVWPDARQPMDFTEYSRRVKSYGVSIRNGESVMVTKVRLKDKLIEFQLAGGGYGTFGDDTSTSTYVSPTPKSRREKQLEDDIKNETDRDRRRRMERELDDLREDRRREDARRQADANAASEVKKARIAQQRLHGGSRFNIRYQQGVPPGLEPAGVMRALSDYIAFPFAEDRPAGARLQAPPSAPPSTGDVSALHKGMSVQEVDALLGRPDRISDRTEGGLKVATSVYTHGDQVVTADFVDGVLIRYSISSK